MTSKNDSPDNEHNRNMINLTQIGFKVSISIECETTEEILAHLHNIMSRIKKERKRFPDREFPDGIDLQFDDNNCYGTHDVTIEPDLR